jgi:DNA-binding response OmpR family regulator
MKEGQNSSASSSARTIQSSPTTPAHRILVVDDDKELRMLSTRALTRSGFHVDAAADGAAGWEALHSNSYDLLITDYDMPKVTGLELVKKLRAARMALPVILATGAIPMDELNRQPWLRPSATLIKPFTVEQLLGTVKEVLRVARTDNRSAEIFGPT